MMERRLLLAQTPDDVTVSVSKFSAELKRSPELQDRLSYARAWYAMKQDDEWVFAPSKWAGYRHMTAKAYLGNSQTSMDGRKTEKHLQQWFMPLDDQSPKYAELHYELAEFLAEYGKQPSAVAESFKFISGAASDEKPEDHLVPLLIAMIKTLDSSQQARIRKALGR